MLNKYTQAGIRGLFNQKEEIERKKQASSYNTDIITQLNEV